MVRSGWSSYAALGGTAPAPSRLQTDRILSQFGPERQKAGKGYGDFVRAGMGLPSVWNPLKGQIHLGSDAFVERLQSLAGKGDLAEIPRAQHRPLPRPLADCRDTFPDRREAMAAAYATGRYCTRSPNSSASTMPPSAGR